MFKINDDLVAELRAGKTAIARRIYKRVYERDLLFGVFADGNRGGCIESRGDQPFPEYARAYIHKFIDKWNKRHRKESGSPVSGSRQSLR